MNKPTYAIGQAVYVRTDLPDYAEETVPFKTLDELIQICSTPRPDRILEKIIMYSLPGERPVAVTLGFLAATHGQHAPALEEEPT